MTLRSGLHVRDAGCPPTLDHLHGEGGVDDVAAGEAEMQPAAGRVVDVLGDIGREGDDVVVERALEFLAAVETEGGATS